MHISSSTKTLSTPNNSQSYPISNTPPKFENYSLHLLLIIYISILNLIFLLATPNYPYYRPLHYSKFFFLMILTVTISLMIPPYTMYGNQPNFTPYSTTY